MKLLILAFIGLAAARTVNITRTTSDEDYWKQWLQFKEDHGKVYATKAHHDLRFNIFMDNIDKINRHNALGLSWELGVTPFADLTAKEFKQQTACMFDMEKKDENDAPLLSEKNLADSVDWVAQGKVTPVKNQQQCGSCWAFSTTGSVESRYAIARGQLNSLSEQELVDCSKSDGNNGCNGGLMDYGFEYVIQEKGLCSENSYPYVAKTETTMCSSNRRKCGQRECPISSFQDVKRNSESQLMAAVSQGPVSIAIEADQTAFQLYKRGVFSGRCGSKLDHGVLAVGYGSEGGQDFWKVKNSWGAGWGEEGYIRLCRNCGKNRNAGQCGIASNPSFPIV